MPRLDAFFLPRLSAPCPAPSLVQKDLTQIPSTKIALIPEPLAFAFGLGGETKPAAQAKGTLGALSYLLTCRAGASHGGCGERLCPFPGG